MVGSIVYEEKGEKYGTQWWQHLSSLQLCVCLLIPGRASWSGECFADDEWRSWLSSLRQGLHLLHSQRERGERRGSVRDITLRHCFRFGTTRNGYRDGRQSTQSALLWAGCLAVVDSGNTGLTEKGRKRLLGEVTAVKKEGKEEMSEMEADRKISDSETEKMAGAGKYIIVVCCLWRFTYSHCGTINGALTHRSMTGIFMSATAISFKPKAYQNLVSSQCLPLLLPHDVHYSDSIRGRQEIIKVATQIK